MSDRDADGPAADRPSGCLRWSAGRLLRLCTHPDGVADQRLRAAGPLLNRSVLPPERILQIGVDMGSPRLCVVTERRLLVVRGRGLIAAVPPAHIGAIHIGERDGVWGVDMPAVRLWIGIGTSTAAVEFATLVASICEPPEGGAIQTLGLAAVPKVLGPCPGRLSRARRIRLLIMVTAADFFEHTADAEGMPVLEDVLGPAADRRWEAMTHRCLRGVEWLWDRDPRYHDPLRRLAGEIIDLVARLASEVRTKASPGSR